MCISDFLFSTSQVIQNIDIKDDFDLLLYFNKDALKIRCSLELKKNS